MMSIHSFTRRLLPILLSLLILAGAMPPAMAAGSFEAVVAVDSMNVYSRQAPYDYLGALPRGTQVTVLDFAGSAALISYRGYTGLARIADLTAAGSASEEPEAAAPTIETTLSKPVVALRDTRVYRQASTSSRYISIKAGTGMTLLGVSGNIAKVERGGAVGYTAYSHLGEGSAPEAETLEQTPETESQPEWREVNTPVVTSQATRVYQQPSTSSRSIEVGKGMKLTLLAISGQCAKVGRGSAVGYMYASHLTTETAEEEAPVQETRRPANPFSSGSNEAVIYSFLIGEMKLNRAAAMGVMANIKYESGYRPGIDGDRGTSYGICQWHLGRKSNLISWCASNNYDYTTLEGQLHFLQYELSTRYTSVLSYLKKVEDSNEGAYDAAYYFCFNFEAPAARTSQSTARGRYARETLYAML